MFLLICWSVQTKKRSSHNQLYFTKKTMTYTLRYHLFVFNFSKKKEDLTFCPSENLKTAIHC